MTKHLIPRRADERRKPHRSLPAWLVCVGMAVAGAASCSKGHAAPAPAPPRALYKAPVTHTAPPNHSTAMSPSPPTRRGHAMASIGGPAPYDAKKGAVIGGTVNSRRRPP